MNKVIVFGSSGHARVVIDILRQEGSSHILGLLDDFRHPGEETDGIPVIGPLEALDSWIPEHPGLSLVVAVGDNGQRAAVVARIKARYPLLPFIHAIHPSAILSKQISLGQGVVVMPGVVVNTGSDIGDFSLLNTRSSLDHDGVMEAFSSLGPGVSTGGNVRIGYGSAVGMGATIRQKIQIGAHTVIGAGAVVVCDIPDHVLAYGVPAKVIRSRRPGEPYL